MKMVKAMIDGKLEIIENPEYILAMINSWGTREGYVGTCRFGGGRKRMLELTEYIILNQCPMEVKHETSNGWGKSESRGYRRKE